MKSVILLFCIFTVSVVSAADLVFTPANPKVEINQKINLSVSGTSSEIKWTPINGKIQGSGSQVTYIAPSDVGIDVVTVLDAAANVGTVKITIIPTVSLENPKWQVFTNRNEVQDIVLSKDNTTLWIATEGGLEQRDAKTGTLNKFFTNLDGLPSNQITALVIADDGNLWLASGTELVRLNNNKFESVNKFKAKIAALISDGNGGLWIATFGAGLVHKNTSLTTYNNLPSQNITSLLKNQDGLWVGTDKGLAHLNNENYLPNNKINALLYNKDGLWVGTDDGLVHFKSKKRFMPNKKIISLASDDNDELWLGTLNQGLIHMKSTSQFLTLNQDNSKLPNNIINALISIDNKLWIGTWGAGLVQLFDDKWLILKNKLGLPYTQISALASDNNGGVWAGNINSQNITHIDNQGKLKVITHDNSKLSVNAKVFALLNQQADNGVWLATSEGLAFITANDQWFLTKTNNIFSLDDDGRDGLWLGSLGLTHVSGHTSLFTPINMKQFANKNISTIARDDSGKLWLGTVNSGIAEYNTNDETWRFFNTDNSNLPSNAITDLVTVPNGGLWVATEAHGLAYLNSQAKWQIFNSNNSDLPNDNVTSLLSDGSNGLWIGTLNGLAHLNANFKFTIFDQQVLALASDGNNGLWIGGMGLAHLSFSQTTKVNNTAIIIAGNDKTSQTISNKIYQVLQQAGFSNETIDYLSPNLWTDINADGLNDHIVDAPVNLNNLRNVLSKQPLYLFIIGQQNLKASELKPLLDDKVVIVVDGANLNSIASISSTSDNELAYFDRQHQQGFSSFFANALLKGKNFAEAFEEAKQAQQQMLGHLSQNPQIFNEESLSKISLKNNTAVSDLKIEAIDKLTAKVSLSKGRINRVWAVLIPPKVKAIIDNKGNTILPIPHLNLTPSNTNEWQTNWNQAIYNGDYHITFYAEDNAGNLAISKSIIMNISNGIEAPEQAEIKLILDKQKDQLKAEIVEQLGWGYDLYAAVILPDGQFITFKNSNDLMPANKVQHWQGDRTPNKRQILLYLQLPKDLAAGEYCLYGILSPEKAAVLENIKLWVQDKLCINLGK
ncbi:ligand-binding sensor domain-containing protein [Candidatus Marithrix sp. Canyon 246]|uniref:ligand-binding sensor domain-containing protein n=1 Tax=Candidatus Marithrix sp. Canyon 246 TaxID=1827136 RepID=UPI00084A241A|nr:two-component regulator propeller domain-containing protein [Candidatus Marithrix sp. Canyon 246]